MNLKTFIWILYLTFVVLVSSVFSQTPRMRQGHGMGMRPWDEGARCWKASELNLSPDQMKGYSLIQQHYIRESQLLRAQLFVKWLELRE
jgi:hypothetical protein